MNSRSRKHLCIVSLVLLVTGVSLLAASIFRHTKADNIKRLCSRIERKIEKRVDLLDSYAGFMSESQDRWTKLDKLPRDMVLYRYVDDTLQCWHNQFPVVNDDIRTNIRYQRLTRPEFELFSSLNQIGEELQFVQLGPKYYLAKWIGKGEITEVLAAIELCSSRNQDYCEHLNRKLGLNKRINILPLASGSGHCVKYKGKALFCIDATDAVSRISFGGTRLRWHALLFLILSALFMLAGKQDWKSFFTAFGIISAVYVLTLIWGINSHGTSPLFSPSLYAGIGPWKSFAALLFLNAYIFLICMCIFMMRRKIVRLAAKNKGTRAFYGIGILLLIVSIGFYIICSIYDLLYNSSIKLEIQWYRTGWGYSILALCAYSLLVNAIMMLFQILSSIANSKAGRKLRFISYSGVALSALIFSSITYGIHSDMNFRKECKRVAVWANRLAVDRNLALEIQIRSIEDALANDSFIPAFADMENGINLIASEVSEKYFRNILSEYYMDVSMCESGDVESNALFNSKLSGGTPLAPGSRFFCRFDNNGRSSYVGSFLFLSRKGSMIRLLVEINSKANKEDNGYYSIFGLNPPGSVEIPEYYSYAKFIDNRLATYRGSYAYPTILAEPFISALNEEKCHFISQGYVHFINKVSDNEVIILTRVQKKSLSLISGFLMIFAGVYCVLVPLLIYRRKRRDLAGRSGFRTRIRWILIITVTIALLILAGVSVKFVFDRNKVDSMNIMSEKISTIQNIIESQCLDVDNINDVSRAEWTNLLQDVSTITKSDISLFSSTGQICASTVGEIFDKALLSRRIDGEAFHSIMHNYQRHCIQREESDGRKYYSLYAPVFNKKGKVIAIVNAPFNRYTEVMKEAFPHAMLILILLVAIIIFSGIVVGHIIDRIFKPLSGLSKRMDAAGTVGLERIDYNYKDELSLLVNSYNRMVDDLKESNKRLAQNERDKAWSSMARQVAHEIKNPLTPMSLEIQKLILLKKNNIPDWDKKFDNSARIILDQISILTDTANEFSTFAKLYSEEPVRINLDNILQDQIQLFSNREGISITYLDLKDAWIMGPRPQLIRVFVNLLTNACQAIESMQKKEESGYQGQIRVELRNDISKGFYEISVEDNGPGVPESNLDKLFTPNFTTKSGGTGLGLAICRNIVEKCNGSISYKKSFTLEGACFTVRLPKNDINNA